MIQKPRLRKYLTLYPISDVAWGIRGGNGEFWSIKLHDQGAMRIFSALLPFLNGGSERSKIVEEVEAMGLSGELAEQFLEQLEAKALIEEADAAGLTDEQLSRHREQITFLSRFGNEGGAKHQAKLLASRIAVIGSGALADSLCRILRLSGIGRVTWLPSPAPEAAGDDAQASEKVGAEEKVGGEEGAAHFATETLALDRTTIFAEDDIEPLPDLVLFAMTAHDPELLEALDIFSKKHDVPWMLVRAIAQFDGWVGPLFIPHDTASYVSFEARLRGNMQAYEEYDGFDRWLRDDEARAAEVGGLRAYYEVLAGMAVSEVVKQVTGVTLSALAGKFVSVDLVTLETEVHEVLRFPRIEEESYSRPGVFPWKELPYDVPQTRRA